MFAIISKDKVIKSGLDACGELKDYLIKRVLNKTIYKTKPLGRPQTEWMDAVVDMWMVDKNASVKYAFDRVTRKGLLVAVQVLQVLLSYWKNIMFAPYRSKSNLKTFKMAKKKTINNCLKLWLQLHIGCQTRIIRQTCKKKKKTKYANKGLKREDLVFSFLVWQVGDQDNSMSNCIRSNKITKITKQQ